MRKVRGLVFILFLHLCALFLYRGAFRKDKVNRILVYGYTGLGNFIMFTPALRKLRQVFPKAHITLQGGAGWGAEEVVRGSDIFDEITCFPISSGWLPTLRWVRKIRKAKYDLIISSFDSSFTMQTCLSGAKYHLGHTSGDGYHNPFDFVYNIKVPVRENRHEIDLKCDLLAAVGEEVIDRTPFFFIDEASRESAHSLRERHGLAGKDYICIQPGAANMMATAKRWDVAKFAILIKKIVNELDIEVLLLGDRNERNMSEFFRKEVSQEQKVHHLFGETTVKEVAAIIEDARLLVSGDSGLMHVALAVGTHLVAIYGPTDYRRTAPRSENAVVIRHEMPCSPCILFEGEKQALSCAHRNCISGITVDEVFSAVLSRLKPSTKQGGEIVR